MAGNFDGIAYSSNVNLKQMAHRCPGSKVVGTAMLQGYELQFKQVATIEKKAQAEMPVLVWKLPQKDERTLDSYEGHPRLYRKENVDLEIDGKMQNAMVYIMNGDRPNEPPSANYYACIRQGYQENGLDTSYLEDALQRSYEPEETMVEDEEMFMGWE